jgi:hypothetical protein
MGSLFFVLFLCVPVLSTSVVAYGEDGSYADVYHAYLNATANDPDGDLMNISFCWGNYASGEYVILKGFYNVTNQSFSIYLPDYFCRDIMVDGVPYTVNWLEHCHRYEWFLWGNDGKNVTCVQNWFDTCKAWDLNMDNCVNYLDMSEIIMHYMKPIAMPGEIPSDINEDGRVNYADISIIMAHYAEMYA